MSSPKFVEDPLGPRADTTPWSVICLGHCEEHPPCGRVYLTREQYMRQLSNLDVGWKCPFCLAPADWDDDSLDTR